MNPLHYIAYTRLERSKEVSCFRGVMLIVTLGGADYHDLRLYKEEHQDDQRALSELVGPHWDPQIAELGITAEDVCVLFEGTIFEEARGLKNPEIVRKVWCMTRRHFTNPAASLWFIMTTPLSLVPEALPAPASTTLRAI